MKDDLGGGMENMGPTFVPHMVQVWEKAKKENDTARKQKGSN